MEVNNSKPDSEEYFKQLSLISNPTCFKKAALEAFNDFIKYGEEKGKLKTLIMLYEDGFLSKEQLSEIKKRYNLTLDEESAD